MEKQIRKIKNKKAAGYDGIGAELIKYGRRELHMKIHELLTEILTNEKCLMNGE